MEFRHTYALLLSLLALLWLYWMGRGKNRQSKVIALNRFIIASLAIAALASPYYDVERISEGAPRVAVLIDSSASMQMYSEAVARLEKLIPRGMEARGISQGNKTALGDELLYALQRGEDVLLVTHGGNNHGRDLLDVAQVAARLNASVHMLNLTPEKSDVAVRTEGNKKVLVGSEEVFQIVLEHVGNESQYALEVTLNDILIYSEKISQKEKQKVVALKHRFDSEGTQRLAAKIVPSSEDYFAENNVFYKSINVIPRPKILFVSAEDSPLEKLLEQIYSVRVSRDLGDLKSYDVVFLNDVSANSLFRQEVEQLREYVSSGRGLVVVGGRHAFDRGNYKDSYFETILPVRSVKSKGEGGLSTVMVIDISGSTGAAFGGQTKADVEKAIAINIIRDLKQDDAFGVIAFNIEAYIVEPLAKHLQRSEVEDKIARLLFEGGTNMYSSQVAADYMLSNASGSRSVIIISDGITGLEASSIQRAKSMATKGIKTYAVGVGYDTNEDFMRRLAEAGDGVYFRPEEHQRLRILFGREEEEKVQVFTLAVVDPSHFIAQNLELRAALTGFNEVTAKSTAKTIAATAEGQPIVAAWRFGLGRIVALSTDDGSQWASQLLSGGNSKLISAITNYAVGDPERGREVKITARDSRIGEAAQISVTAPRAVSLKIEGKEAKLASVGEKEYLATFEPERMGFYALEASTYADLLAINYPVEFKSLGYDAELAMAARITGGATWELSPELLQHLQDSARTRSQQKVIEKVDARMPFLEAALALFLIEVVTRRIAEIRKIQRAE